jgi:hypothetical protein
MVLMCETFVIWGYYELDVIVTSDLEYCLFWGAVHSSLVRSFLMASFRLGIYLVLWWSFYVSLFDQIVTSKTGILPSWSLVFLDSNPCLKHIVSICLIILLNKWEDGIWGDSEPLCSERTWVFLLAIWIDCEQRVEAFNDCCEVPVIVTCSECDLRGL